MSEPNTQTDSRIESEREGVRSMWWCPECETWNGKQLPACLKCERDRPRRPVFVDDVSFDYAGYVTWKHRALAKLGLLGTLR